METLPINTIGKGSTLLEISWGFTLLSADSHKAGRWGKRQHRKSHKMVLETKCPSLKSLVEPTYLQWRNEVCLGPRRTREKKLSWAQGTLPHKVPGLRSSSSTGKSQVTNSTLFSSLQGTLLFYVTSHFIVLSPPLNFLISPTNTVDNLCGKGSIVLKWNVCMREAGRMLKVRKSIITLVL